MTTLADHDIVLSKKGDASLTGKEANDLLSQVPGWNIIEEDGMARLQRVYGFSDYLLLLDLGHKIGCMAQQVDHHPLLVTEWGKLTVTWWTHTIDGLHLNDFIMAARCDRVAQLISAP